VDTGLRRYDNGRPREAIRTLVCDFGQLDHPLRVVPVLQPDKDRLVDLFEVPRPSYCI